MSNTYISEHDELPLDDDGRTVQIPGKTIASQSISTSGTAASGTALKATTKYIMVMNASSAVAINLNGTASASAFTRAGGSGSSFGVVCNGGETPSVIELS